MKRLLIITDLFLNNLEPYRAPFNREIFTRLAQEVNVKVVAPVSWIKVLRTWKSGKCGDGFRPREMHKGIEVFHPTYFYLPGVLRSLQGLWYFLSIFSLCRWIEKRQGIDCIFSGMIYPDGFAATLVAKMLKRPLFLNAIGTDINVYARYRLRREMIQWSLRESRGIIAVSNALREKILDLGIAPEKVRVVYDGVDQSVFRLDAGFRGRAENPQKTILFVGNLKVAKGILDLLEGYRLLDDRNTRLVYVGSGPDKGKLLSAIHSLELDERVVVTGPFSHEIIADWMRRSTVLCLPSHNEGVPNVILESLACGTPVVATSVGGIPEVMTPECGTTVSVRSHVFLAERLREALQRKWDREKIAAYASKFDWDVTARSILNEMRNALHASGN